MKKIIVTLFALIVTLSVYGQGQTLRIGTLAADTVKARVSALYIKSTSIYLSEAMGTTADTTAYKPMVRATANGLLQQVSWATFPKTDTTSLSNRINQRWSILGNAGTSTASNYLGTSDNASIVFKVAQRQFIIADSSNGRAIYGGGNTSGAATTLIPVAPVTIRDSAATATTTPVLHVVNTQAGTQSHLGVFQNLGTTTGTISKIRLLTTTITSGSNYTANGTDISSTRTASSNNTFSIASRTNGANMNIGMQIHGDNGRISLATGTFQANSTPSFTLSLNGDSVASIGMERHTTAATNGNNLLLFGGGATSGGRDKNGGMVQATPGVTTGCGRTSIRLQGYRRTHYSASATADNAAQDRYMLASEKPLVDAANDTLFSVVLGADSMFFATLNYTVYVNDDDSAHGESGNMFLSFANNGTVATSSFTSTQTQAVPAGVTLGRTLSTSYVRATGTLYVLVNFDTNVHLTATEFVRMTYAVNNTGARHGAITQF